MKSIMFFVCILLSACAGLSQEWQNAIAFGSIEELNKLSPGVEKHLLLRLYRSPYNTKNCFVETHGVCQYEYFLSVSSYDEIPETNIYKLKHKGEITKIEWKRETKNDSAKLSLTFNRFTKEALNNNNSLKSGKNIVQIDVNLEQLVELGIDSSNQSN